MSDRPSATDMQPTLCSVAKRMANEHFGIRLDLTTRSVRHVEKILGAIHKEHLKSRADAGFDNIALEYAAYIVEVIQGHFGPALWQRDCPRQGVDSFPLYWRNQILYPYAWCQKRIYDGAADDVWSRFSGVVLGKSARRWWQPFGRRAGDTAGPSVARPSEVPATGLDGAPGRDVERRTRHPSMDRRQLPLRDERSVAPLAARELRQAQDDEVDLVATQTPDALEACDVLDHGPLNLAGVAIDQADPSPQPRRGSGSG